MTAVILYSMAASALLISFIKDRQKTKKGLIKGGKSFLKLLPDVIAIMCFVGITLAVLKPEVISKVLSPSSRFCRHSYGSGDCNYACRN